MNHMLINKSMINAKMINAKMINAKMINAKMVNNTIHKKIAELSKKIATLNTKTDKLNISQDVNLNAKVKILEDLNIRQDANLFYNFGILDEKLVLADKTRDEKSKISMRLSLIDLYKIERNFTKRNQLIILIDSAINHSKG
jgi:hypothetical protein